MEKGRVGEEEGVGESNVVNSGGVSKGGEVIGDEGDREFGECFSDFWKERGVWGEVPIAHDDGGGIRGEEVVEGGDQGVDWFIRRAI